MRIGLPEERRRHAHHHRRVGVVAEVGEGPQRVFALHGVEHEEGVRALLLGQRREGLAQRRLGPGGRHVDHLKLHPARIGARIDHQLERAPRALQRGHRGRPENRRSRGVHRGLQHIAPRAPEARSHRGRPRRAHGLDEARHRRGRRWSCGRSWRRHRRRVEEIAQERSAARVARRRGRGRGRHVELPAQGCCESAVAHEGDHTLDRRRAVGALRGVALTERLREAEELSQGGLGGDDVGGLKVLQRREAQREAAPRVGPERVVHLGLGVQPAGLQHRGEARRRDHKPIARRRRAEGPRHQPTHPNTLCALRRCHRSSSLETLRNVVTADGPTPRRRQ